jgi:hypothetical protein
MGMKKNIQNTIILIINIVALLTTFAKDYRIKSTRKQVQK